MSWLERWRRRERRYDEAREVRKAREANLNRDHDTIFDGRAWRSVNFRTLLEEIALEIGRLRKRVAKLETSTMGDWISERYSDRDESRSTRPAGD